MNAKLRSALGWALNAVVVGVLLWAAYQYFTDPMPAARRAEAAFQRGDLDGAIAEYTKSIDRRPTGLAYHNRALVHVSKQDWPAVVADMTMALELGHPGWEAQIYTMRGQALVYSGQPRDAIQDSERAIALDPDKGLAYVVRGLAKGALGATDSALADYTRAIEVEPTCAEAWSNRGMQRIELGQETAGKADLDEAFRLDPNILKRFARTPPLQR